MVRIIGTGSTGNAIIYHDSILVDCGVPYSLLKPYVKDLKLVLLTHEHKDHINATTLINLYKNRPTLRIGCCKWMLPLIPSFKNIDLLEIGKLYDYGQFKVSPIQLYHDVPNVGYRIFKDETKILHATDTAHLQGISAKNYDLYCIESNYNEDTVWDTIQRIEAAGGYAHQRGSINSHLSEQQTNDFYYANKGEHSQLIRLHISNTK
jgi:L-ascorbate metabolism protein UlaG (beta-lactamase superfamily)